MHELAGNGRGQDFDAAQLDAGHLARVVAEHREVGQFAGGQAA